jgi:hypothetical protein
MRQIGLIVVVAALVLAAVVLHQVLGRISIPQRQLLCQLQAGGQEVSFVAPKGDHFNLVVGVPKKRTNAEVGLSGKLSLRVGANLVGEMQFDARESPKANWLDKDSLDAYVITLPSNGSPKHFDQHLKHGSVVAIQVETTASPGEGASLWLTYLTRRADLRTTN